MTMILRTDWRTDSHLNYIKKKIKCITPEQYIVIIKPDRELKNLKKLGFTVKKISVPYPYDAHGFYQRGEVAQFFKVAILKDKNELNFLKLVAEESIYDCVQAAAIVSTIP